MGTVTNPTGSVKGITLTGLTDAYTGNWGDNGTGTYDGTTSPSGAILAQAQHLVLLSATTGACSREGQPGGAFGANEVTLRFVMVIYADLPDSVPTIPGSPVTFTTGVWDVPTTTAGAHRRATATFMKAKSNGAAGTDTVASSGTVTFTRMDSTAYEGSYDLYFGTDHVTGSFAAPWC